MTSTLTVAVFCALAGATAAQCGKSDHPNCATWQRNGQFCTNPARPLAVRQQYCPITCGNLGCPGGATTTAKPGSGVENTNCAKWSSDSTKPFCVNSMTVAQKAQYCPATCAFEIKPTADCALYTVTDKKFVRGTPSNKTSPEKAIASEAVASKTTVSRAYAGTGCTVKLFADAAPADLTKPTVSFVGKADAHFFTVPDANNAALSYSCTCA
ncbi:hypothetical protein PRIPAC_80103 [Pristionchus pacificus]|uniref:ShK domain-containing protein n=1 Tax=Pristionchus pacificus TaxID=54126 RepID=A0A2A6CMQ5_PRIPA|nr:hypothetical protein PRIPAC_80103 [Pristionchus pacificus]|eukprot:PDM79386.1 ShK domain-containing protein [Pristionchus pacificus]